MIVIAHRGASGYAPENTLEAFGKAVAMGARAFEFDIHRSADGKLVVHHDYDFKRTAGSDKKIKDLSFGEIKKINVAKHFRPEGAASAPLLEEVLRVIKNYADFVNFEIKNDENVYPGIEEDVIGVLKAAPELLRKTLVSSFYFPTIEKLRSLSSEVRLGFLGHRLSTALLFPALKKAKSARCENFHLSSRIAFRLNIKALVKRGFKVCVYTVNEKKAALKFGDYGVYGIFSNYPDILGKED